MDLRVRARIEARRELAAQGLGDLYERLNAILYEHDPLQLGRSGNAQDEYGSPVSTIIPRLTMCSDRDTLRYVLEDEMKKHYPQWIGESLQLERIADEFWSEWQSLKRYQR